MRIGITSCLLFLVTFLHGQGLIINEFSNGNSGVKEWVEFVVIGNPSNPSAPVNISGWGFDDNGGNFEGSQSSVGIADGHLRFSNTYNSVPAGSIIVVYNENEKSTNIPTDDPIDSNNDSVYIIAGDNSFMQACSSVPAIGNFTYNCTPSNPSDWSVMALRNSGDALQVITPTNTFFHGFSYGNVGAPFPFFPSGISSWNIGSGNPGLAQAFTCGDWEDKSSYSEIQESNSTPGASNNGLNSQFVQLIRSGTFNYTTKICTPIDTVFPPIDSSQVVIKPIIEVPNVFSPNGDGDNDYFIIDSLEFYSKRDLMIFSRWGNKVFSTSNYNNDWDGNNAKGKKLTEGTYFYILDVGSEQKKGYINLYY